MNPEKRTSWTMLGFNTFAFTVCFACWMMNGVLVTFLIANGVFDWDARQMGWLIGIPVLTGAIFRLPMGILTDKYGGRWVYGILLVATSIPMYLYSLCNTYEQFLMASLGFGLTGTSFAVGIAYSSVWFPRKEQGTALGIFGAGNAGAALTSVFAPKILASLTANDIDGWRHLPQIYAVMLLVMGIVFLIFTKNKLPHGSAGKTLLQRLAPLKHVRVWRFGLYYFFVFGGFVALAQWLIPYYVNVYSMTVGMAGFLAAWFSFPSGVIRAVGGWMSDKFGARKVMYGVWVVSLICCGMLIIPRMDISSPGSGVMAKGGGTVTSVSATEIVVASEHGDRSYTIKQKAGELVTDEERHSGFLIWPRSQWWQEPAVKVGDQVTKKQLLASGETHVFFQANVWIFTALCFILGSIMGIGKAAVYKYIPDYFPDDVGVVGGIVGVLGGLGGFICPVIFGYLLKSSGLWITCWMFFFVIVAICLFWMHHVISNMKGHTSFEEPHAE